MILKTPTTAADNGQPTKGRPFYGQAKGQLWLTWRSYAGPPQHIKLIAEGDTTPSEPSEPSEPFEPFEPFEPSTQPFYITLLHNLRPFGPSTLTPAGRVKFTPCISHFFLIK